MGLSHIEPVRPWFGDRLTNFLKYGTFVPELDERLEPACQDWMKGSNQHARAFARCSIGTTFQSALAQDQAPGCAGGETRQ
jgi:hypothetical protein